ncbi:enoyl-CoA hydratase [Hyaloraphidium curvatum]|nr:enoyl-CoA hydratase [Hyaloraphidium curvatum]
MAWETKKYTTIELSRDSKVPSVLIMTISREKQMNAWTEKMTEEMNEVYRGADAADDVRAVIVTGKGKAVRLPCLPRPPQSSHGAQFCAGADLQVGDFSTGPTSRFRNEPDHPRTEASYRDDGGITTTTINQCRKPVIAAINGTAVGIGITMTLAMDIRFVYRDALIGFVFTQRGLVPEAASTYFLPRLIGHSRAMSVILNGAVIKASDRRLDLLWADILDTREAVLERALEEARLIATKTSAISVALAKNLIWRGTSSPEEQHLLDSKAMQWVGDRDGREGVASFLEKRDAKFSGKVSTDMPPWYPWYRLTDIKPPKAKL